MTETRSRTKEILEKVALQQEVQDFLFLEARLLDERRLTEWLDLLGHPEFGLNADGGGGGFNPDKSPAGSAMQTAEKTFASYTLTVRNRGGHSSKPRKDN